MMKQKAQKQLRVGLIAMSGVRACDRELLALGLTLPGFVERSETIASLPSLGLITLASLSPDWCEVSYHEVDQIDDWSLDEMDSFDVIAISTFTAQVKEAYVLCERLKNHGVQYVVMGGLHATSLPDEALQFCDSVIVGEGELVWKQMLVDARDRCLKSKYRASQPFDLADAPMPAYELLDIQRYNRLTVQTSRGCPFKCEFCASSILLTDKYKQKPMEKVLAEVDKICELWKRPFIEFADDNSFVNRGYWKKLLPELAKRKVKWFTETDLSVAWDDELLDLMRMSGCAEVLIGLESPSIDGLNGLETKGNWKAKQLGRYQEGITKIQSAGIRVNGCFILGLDGHDVGIFDRVLAFADKLELYDVQVTYLTPFPGTPLYSRLRREGRLLEENAWERCTLFDITYQPKGMSCEQLRAGFHQLVKELYSEENTSLRRDRFKHKYRQASRSRLRNVSHLKV
ncbi:Radical SAM superfamily protein [Poriferisphaera corsica]|uniref:Radical SAM superfamily protein n=1 Tax=Poriferisphaera corsica TaxID=2528020 RepID=A0A517YQI4_9BACT|nr:radical SAM protein [Poriferisphaera corsica]QDU32486.1 Radical SAM superfamily protein [Poriferisphaera corsica]